MTQRPPITIVPPASRPPRMKVWELMAATCSYLEIAHGIKVGESSYSWFKEADKTMLLFGQLTHSDRSEYRNVSVLFGSVYGLRFRSENSIILDRQVDIDLAYRAGGSGIELGKIAAIVNDDRSITFHDRA
jgi:hypothetical protein